MKVLLLVAALLAVLAAAPGSARGASPGPAVWPLDPQPTVVTGFDPPATPWGSGHRGVDLLGSPGQPVRAALAGRISFAGMLAGRGLVVVDHGETRTTYEPVDPTVAPGALVRAGDVLGTLRAGPLNHCFPRVCLHWGLLRGAVYLDPLGLLGDAPVRLLPLFAPWSLFVPPGLLMPGGAPAGTPTAAVPP